MVDPEINDTGGVFQPSSSYLHTWGTYKASDVNKATNKYNEVLQIELNVDTCKLSSPASKTIESDGLLLFENILSASSTLFVSTQSSTTKCPFKLAQLGVFSNEESVFKEKVLFKLAVAILVMTFTPPLKDWSRKNSKENVCSKPIHVCIPISRNNQPGKLPMDFFLSGETNMVDLKSWMAQLTMPKNTTSTMFYSGANADYNVLWLNTPLVCNTNFGKADGLTMTIKGIEFAPSFPFQQVHVTLKSSNTATTAKVPPSKTTTHDTSSHPVFDQEAVEKQSTTPLQWISEKQKKVETAISEWSLSLKNKVNSLVGGDRKEGLEQDCTVRNLEMNYSDQEMVFKNSAVFFGVIMTLLMIVLFFVMNVNAWTILPIHHKDQNIAFLVGGMMLDFFALKKRFHESSKDEDENKVIGLDSLKINNMALGEKGLTKQKPSLVQTIPFIAWSVLLFLFIAFVTIMSTKTKYRGASKHVKRGLVGLLFSVAVFSMITHFLQVFLVDKDKPSTKINILSRFSMRIVDTINGFYETGEDANQKSDANMRRWIVACFNIALWTCVFTVIYIK